MMRLLLFSDLHADWTTAGFCRYADAARSAGEVVDVAREKKVDAVVFLGDLCDPDIARSQRAIALAIATASKLSALGIPSTWLTGNHDVVEDGSGASTLSALAEHGGNATVIDAPKAGFLSGAWAVALPYVPRSHAYDPAGFVASAGEEYRAHGKGRPVIVLAHLNIEGIAPGSETTDMPRGRVVFLPTAAIAEHFPDALVLSGHYHRRQTWTSPEGVVVRVVGSCERLTFGEEQNDPGFMLVEWD